MPTNRSAKASQQKAPPTPTWSRRKSKKRDNQRPQDPPEQFPFSPFAGIPILCNVQSCTTHTLPIIHKAKHNKSPIVPTNKPPQRLTHRKALRNIKPPSAIPVIYFAECLNPLNNTTPERSYRNEIFSKTESLRHPRHYDPLPNTPTLFRLRRTLR